MTRKWHKCLFRALDDPERVTADIITLLEIFPRLFSHVPQSGIPCSQLLGISSCRFLGKLYQGLLVHGLRGNSVKT